MKIMATGMDPIHYWLWCPGCKDIHMIDNTWHWDGDMDEPTITPSIKVTGGAPMFPTGETSVCHSFVTKGEWDFLSDSTHKLAGLTVPMVDLPEHFTIDE